MGKKIIFVDSSKTSIRYQTSYNYDDGTIQIDYWDTSKSFIGKTRLLYPAKYSVMFLKYDGNIFVRSQKYTNSMNLSAKALEGFSEVSLYAYISEAFKIFDDINAQCKSEGKAPVWRLEFDLDDLDLVLSDAMTQVFDAFSYNGSRGNIAAIELHYNYHPSALYNMMVKNLIKRDHKTSPIDVDKVEELKLAQRIMRDHIYGINGGSNMDKLYNFRKNIKEIKRDKKNPGKFLLNTKDGFLSREIVCDGFSKEELYSEEFIESILVIATQIQYDGITKVIFNKKEKLTIIFPHNSYNFSEKIIVKANGSDAFNILKGYSIAKAKMLCSGDGYQWYNKLRKSGKVDV